MQKTNLRKSKRTVLMFISETNGSSWRNSALWWQILKSAASQMSETKWVKHFIELISASLPLSLADFTKCKEKKKRNKNKEEGKEEKENIHMIKTININWLLHNPSSPYANLYCCNK